MKELQALRLVVERKKLQYQNVQNIAAALYQSKSGAEILEAVEALHKPQPINEPEQQQEHHAKKKEKGETHRLSLQLYKEGKSIAEIAQERNLAPSTIEGHLASFIPTGEINVLELVDQSKLDKILKVLEEESEPVFATSVKNKLGNDYSFSEVRAAMKYWEKEKKESN
ncbi:helix-turn-helix domain-containing protein [Chitinophagaceae bacterium LB-8]|uniref:Helix-turn-helix domain-containing protein n=2 Tax=Paraflavisolibacter caeni TaxID=2982496 RepID=A0A9X3BH91_9BACT|nr:helix-turn-helix domain-containing protein [Paraflavisolibacter caeni]